MKVLHCFLISVGMHALGRKLIITQGLDFLVSFSAFERERNVDK